jgi:GNAT superfamily N-acetyltransferase
VVSDRLLLLEHGLNAIDAPDREIETGGIEPLEELYAIDNVSFLTRWRLGRIGLAESFSATARSVVMRIRSNDGRCLGFAISGVALGTGYLQRLAVTPEQRGIGIGRDLVGGSLLWARRLGAMRMLVNTQTDNLGAAALYHRTGFRDVPGGLLLFRFEPADGSS